MTMFILLTAAQADHVRGPSALTPAAALVPVERRDGPFVLGIDVLADPAHATHREYLSALPQLDGSDPSLPAATSPDDA
jgi:hypothetical protein